MFRVVLGPEKMILIPPCHYCVIENPVQLDKDDQVVLDAAGQAKLLHADKDIRLARDPFPLYPGEILKQPVSPLKVVVANTALRFRATIDFVDETGKQHIAGNEWLFEGPGVTLLTSDSCCSLALRGLSFNRVSVKSMTSNHMLKWMTENIHT